MENMFNVDATELVRKLGWMSERQIPFVIAKALTVSAEEARLEVGIETRRNFHLHSEFIPRNVRKEPALKSDVKTKGYGEAAVLTGRALDGWMGLQEYGGLKLPHSSGQHPNDKGTALTQRGKELSDLNYLTNSGKIRARWEPGNVLGFQKTKTATRAANGKGGGRTAIFMTRSTTSGQKMIVYRAGRARLPLKVLYVFTKEASISPAWHFDEAVQRRINKCFHKNFVLEYRRALGAVL